MDFPGLKSSKDTWEPLTQRMLQSQVFLEELSLFSSKPATCEAISRVAFHPKIPVVATACDDHTWKMWSMPEGLQDHSCIQFPRSCRLVPAGQLVLSGEGHRLPF